MDSQGRLIVDENQLVISMAINKKNGIKSYVITEKKQETKTTLRSLQFVANGNPEADASGTRTSGWWYDGHDCFVYGTLWTDDNGVQLFFEASVATRELMNICGWSNVG